MEKDALFVTLAVPPPPKLTMEVVLPPARAAIHMSSQAPLAKPAAPLFVSSRRASGGVGQLRKGNVSAALVSAGGTRAQRQWIVPAFNSKTGFEAGMYDEDTEIMYYD